MKKTRIELWGLSKGTKKYYKGITLECNEKTAWKLLGHGARAIISKDIDVLRSQHKRKGG